MRCAGVIHRDLKPDSILVHNGEVQVADFGLAGLDSGSPISFLDQVGAVPFLAPEVLQERCGAASDVYASGVILLIMLTGKIPFNGQDSEYSALLSICRCILHP